MSKVRIAKKVSIVQGSTRTSQKSVCHDVPDGNTIASGPSNIREQLKYMETNPLYRYCFTLKASVPIVPDEPKALWTTLMEHCKELYFQMEEGGTETAYLHYQGVFSLKVKHRFGEVKNIIGRDDVHLEKVKNWEASKKYCQKSDSRIGGPWTHKSTWIDTIQHLLPWQQDVEDNIVKTDPDKDLIYWLYDLQGGKGKTSFCKYLAVKHNAMVFNNAKTADIAYAMPEGTKLVVFNLSRSTNIQKFNYGALENLKDGLIFSSKYESGMKIFNVPTVIVFSNEPPCEGAISDYKWCIIDLNNIITSNAALVQGGFPPLDPPFIDYGESIIDLCNLPSLQLQSQDCCP